MTLAALELIRRIGIWSMCAALVLGGISWWTFEQHVSSPGITVLTNIAWFLWVICGLIIWVKAWNWLFGTWSERGALSNGLWLLAIAFGSIILPLLAYRRFLGGADANVSTRRRLI